MIIDNAGIKTLFVPYQKSTDQHEKAAHGEDYRGYRPEHSYKDRFQFSDAAKLSSTRMRKVDLEKKPEAEHGLNIQIIKSMVKKITGQDLQLFSPQALQDIAEQVSVQEPTQAPEQSSNEDSGLVYQQSLAYFESQTTTFSAQGIINTKDGQQVNFSVSLSMSHMFYAGIDLAQTQSDQSGEDSINVNFAGNAAELTTTHFQFSVDTKGSQDQVETIPSISDTAAQESNQAEAVDSATENRMDASANNNTVINNRLTAAVKSIYRQLKIWQHHTDGSTQLLALGEKSVGALYLGHLTSSMPSLLLDNKSDLGESDDANSFVHNSQSSAEHQINFTA